MLRTGHTGERTAWERGVRMDTTLEGNGVGGDGMLPPLFPAKRVT